jgi:hypothetical protein
MDIHDANRIALVAIGGRQQETKHAKPPNHHDGENP